MRTPLGKGMESTLDVEPQSHIMHLSEGKKLELIEFPPIKLPKLSGYAIWCWGYRGSNISHPKLTIPTSKLYPSVNT